MSAHARRADFFGNGGSLFWIQLVNALLTVITLGIYSFWAKTKVRDYLYGQTEFDGDRFSYRGTGMELFRGWLKAMGLLFLIGIGAGLVSLFVNDVMGALALYGAVFAWLFPKALLGARRYRLSRTSWRGIRFSFRGELGEFIGIFIPGIIFTTITLGLYYPFFHANVRRFLVEHSYYGTEPFDFDGEGGDLFGPHVLALVLTPLTLGLYWFWYAAFRHRYYWDHTAIDEGRFVSTVTGGGLLGLWVVNVLLLVVTLGIAMPWVKVRVVRYHCDNIALEGPVDLSAVAQDPDAAGAVGEELTDILDVDIVGADFFGL